MTRGPDQRRELRKDYEPEELIFELPIVTVVPTLFIVWE